MFSARLPSLAQNQFAMRLAELRRNGTPLLDLTETNPTRVGIDYPPGLLQELASSAGLAYAPDAQGLRAAREAIAVDHLRHGVEVDPSRLFLTASTSEAYAFLFKLLCDPGDEVLVPAPSYPLFDHLAALEAIRPIAYSLDRHADWRIDPGAVETAMGSRTRAVIVVSPNNPTGSILGPPELERLASVCRDRAVALIGDEVFLDFLFDRDPQFASVLTQSQCLTFGLGGFSKSIGLPQAKLAWIAVSGPETAVALAQQRLELIADTYLSVSTHVQLAAASLLEQGKEVRARIQARVAGNLHALRRAAGQAPACSLLEPRGGWSAVVRVPAQSEDTLVLALLDREHVVVMPGYFFDFPTEAYVVVSLLPSPETFATGVDRLLGFVASDSRA